MILIVNNEIPENMLNKLVSKGYNVIKSMKLSDVNMPVATHPDIQVHKLQDDLLVCAPECYEYYRSCIPDRIMIYKGSTKLFGTYPNDCAYNVARIGSYVFSNTKHTDKNILEFYRQNNKKIIHVKQGYTACNSLVIGNVILTEDIGIHNTIMVNKLKIKSILLPKGEISLTGFPYGFIGGAAGGLKNKLYWYGSPATCSYCNILKDVLKEEGVNSIALSSDPLQDLGGIICFP